MEKYQLHEKIHEGKKNILYKGIRKEDGLPVVIKLLKGSNPTHEEIEGFKKEYDITKEINAEGIVKIYELLVHKQKLLLIMEDFGGESLREYLNRKSLGLEDFLKLAIELANVIDKVHEKNILHKDINPKNIIINFDKQIIKLTGFGRASYIYKKTTTKKSPYFCEGSFPYMAPEDTGRIKQQDGFSSDLYALGMIYYEVLAGKLPFETEDQMTVLHFHLAQTPPALHENFPGIPKVVSNIIEKLMEKKPENRYLTAYALKQDLLKVFKGLKEKQGAYVTDNFKLAEEDREKSFHLPDKLYDRFKQLEELKKAFQDTMKGKKKVVFVTGVSGVGKTSLIQKAMDYTKSHNGLSISGKFDEYSTSVPYFALIQGFRNISKGILAEDEKILQRWRKKLLAALGKNAQLIIDVIPEIEKIIGPQLPPPKLPPLEAKNRFEIIFLNFIGVFTSKETPLVVFLDDLQWMDASSAKLIKAIMQDQEIGYLLLIGAYRYNEISNNHLLKSILKLKESFITMQLDGLKEDAISRMLLETFRGKLQDRENLAELCFSKTNGNPFFLIQFLYTLKDEGLLYFDTKARQWRWDKEKILQKVSTDNVVDFVISKIKKLPHDMVELLKIAACINSTFTIKTLIIATGKHESFIKNLVDAIVKEGLLLQEGKQFRFLHDRVQQAAYLMIGASDKERLHYKIGKLLQQRLSSEEKEEKVFEILYHFNHAKEIIIEKKEEHLLLRLNLQAGEKAKASSAYEKALDYFMFAVKVSSEEDWKDNYNLMLKLYVETIESAYVCTEFGVMESLSKEALKNVSNILDQAKIYEVIIEAYTAQHDLDKALSVTRHTLKLLGVSLPENPNLGHILNYYIKTKIALRNRKIESLLKLPFMTDIKQLTILRLLNKSSYASYSTCYKTAVLMAFHAILIGLKYGIADETVMIYLGYGFTLCASGRDVELGYKFGRLGMQLRENLNIKGFNARSELWFNTVIRHHREPLRNTLMNFPGSYEEAFCEGDLLSAGHLMMQHFEYSFFAGKELNIIEKEMKQHEKYLLKTKHETSIGLSHMYLQVVCRLKNGSDTYDQLTGVYFDEGMMLPRALVSNDKTILFNMFLHKSLLNYFFSKPKNALKNIIMAEKYKEGVEGSFHIVIFHFYKALIIAANFDELKGFKKYHYLLEIHKHIKIMEKMKNTAQENIVNKLYLMKAEEARLKKQYLRAMDYYDQAIESSCKNQFIQEEALSNELAGKFYLSLNKDKLADNYIREAYDCYLGWHALEKAKDIKNSYSKIFSKNNKKISYASKLLKYSTNPTSPLDIMAIIKANHAISKTIVMEELLSLLTEGLLQYSGAQRVVLMIKDNEEFLIRAVGNQEGINVMRAVPLDESINLPKKLIHYVTRTQETVVLNDMDRDKHWLTDPYLQRERPNSLLSMPVVFKRKTVGILYLENNLIEGAFTEGQLEILKLFSTQIAISIENAMLYQNMEKRIDASTIELKTTNSELSSINEKLKKANEAKDQFVANISHEIRTPLHGIMGMNNLLKKTLLSKEQKNYLEMIETSAQVLLEIINDLLDTSKLEVNKITLEQKIFPIKKVLKKMLQPFLYKGKEKSISVQYYIDDLIPQYVKGDSLKIQQVLSNILTNAIKFTDKGKVIFKAKMVAIEEKKIQLLFSIEDTGIGIPKDKTEEIFERFIQGDKNINKNYGGTGLGLAISKQLIELMKGRIEVETTLGQGSVFRCYISLEIAEDQDSSFVEEEDDKNFEMQGVLKKLKVLVAEDNELNQRYIQALLTYYGCEVKLAKNGHELLALLDSFSYDCIIMDKNMPSMDGIEATKLIRKKEDYITRHIPIIVLTASSIKGDKEKLIDAGADYYLSKPTKEKDLISILEEVRRNRKNLPKTFIHPKTLENGEKTYKLVDKVIFDEEMHFFTPEIIKENIEEFLNSYEALMHHLELSIREKNYTQIEKTAHKLASSVSHFYAASVCQVAKSIERSGIKNNIEEAQNNFNLLEELLQNFIEELQRIKEELK